MTTMTVRPAVVMPESRNALADFRSHRPEPDNTDPKYQETFFLNWWDPIHRAGGFHHIDIQYGSNRAGVWSWLALDGRVVGNYQNLDLPLPDGDFSQLACGPFQILPLAASHSPEIADGHGYGLRIENGPAVADVTYAASMTPYSCEMDGGGSELCAGHYESSGWFKGSLTLDGKTVDLSGAAFEDHSWGHRDYSTIKAYRWAWAMFDDDLFFSIFSFSGDAGRRDFGYVYDGGRFHHVTQAKFNARVDDDGCTPIDADLQVWTDDRRGYRMHGTVDVSHPCTQDGGYFAMDSLGHWEMGGRRGVGSLSVSELKWPSPGQQRALGLAP